MYSKSILSLKTAKDSLPPVSAYCCLIMTSLYSIFLVNQFNLFIFNHVQIVLLYLSNLCFMIKSHCKLYPGTRQIRNMPSLVMYSIQYTHTILQRCVRPWNFWLPEQASGQKMASQGPLGPYYWPDLSLPFCIHCTHTATLHGCLIYVNSIRPLMYRYVSDFRSACSRQAKVIS